MQWFIPSDDVEFDFGDADYPTDPFAFVRKSKDETCNRFGTSLIDLCYIQNMHILKVDSLKILMVRCVCVSCAPEFQCCYFCESSCLFYLSFDSDFYVSTIMHI